MQNYKRGDKVVALRKRVVTPEGDYDVVPVKGKIVCTTNDMVQVRFWNVWHFSWRWFDNADVSLVRFS